MIDIFKRSQLLFNHFYEMIQAYNNNPKIINMNLKILKNTLLLFLTGIILTSCELQEEAIHQHEHNSILKLYEMKLEELMTNKRFVNSFSKLPKSKKSLTTATVGRTVMENEYGFTIANKPAKVIEDNGETSYTFLITRDSTDANSFENLVIQTDSTNTTKAVIIKYNITSPITSSADDSYSFTYNREVTPIVYNNTTVSETSKMVIVCHWVYTLVCNNTRTGEIGPEHIAGPNCGRTYYNWTEECFSFDDGISNGGGSGPTGSGPTGGSTNTGSNVGSGGTGGANSINTSPVNNSIEFSETVSNFLQSLTPNQLEYWDDLEPRTQQMIIDYLEENVSSTQSIMFAINAIENLNIEDCTTLPNVFNPLDIEADFDSSLFGDYPDPLTDPDHNAIQQQFINLRNTSGNLAAVNYLISTYNMNTFGPNTVNFSYSISFGNGLPTGDHANAIIGYNASGNMVTCQLQIDTNLLSYTDFGYITRVIKHELYHVLQAEFYGQNGLSNPAREFDAYWASIFRFNNLKKIEDLSLTNGLANLMCKYMNQMSLTEKSSRSDMIDTVNETFSQICKN